MTSYKPKVIKRRAARRRRVATRRRLSYANVVSTLALFIALGGVGYAAAAWTGDDIVDGTLTGADVKDKSLAKSDLAYNSVGTGELESSSVIGGHVVDGSLTGADVKDNSLGQPDIGTDAIGYDELAYDAIRSGHILDGQVTSADVANGGLLSQDAAPSFKAPDADSVDGIDSTRILRDYERVESSGSVASSRGGVGTAVAICPAGKRVVGGGHLSYAGELRIVTSYPSENDRWKVVVINDSTVSPGVVVAYAICARAT